MNFDGAKIKFGLYYFLSVIFLYITIMNLNLTINASQHLYLIASRRKIMKKN